MDWIGWDEHSLGSNMPFGGVLVISNLFGSKLLKPFVVVELEFQKEDTDGVDFIIIL